MKRFLEILFFLLLILGCSRKPLYLRGLPEPCELLTTVTVSVSTNTNLQRDIDENLIYKWNDSLYGSLSYELPDTINGLFFRKKLIREISVRDTFIVNVPKITRIYTDTNYDVLFYNKTYNTTYVHDDVYEYWTVSPFREPRTKFDYTDKYSTSFNTDEHFACMIKDMYIDTYYNKVDSKLNDDGSITYFYNIEAEISPMSYIYIIQVCVVDDSEEYPMNIDSCVYIGINGVAREGELFTQKTTDERCLIESYKTKPRQIIDSMYVFAEKFVTFGLVDNFRYSWTNANLDYEVGLEFMMNDGTTKKGRINVSKQLRDKPNGGVITITLNNSDINKPQNSTSSGGFEVEVEGWQEEVNVTFII